jgi:deoxyribodipyrimidine photo-lyase
MSAAAPTAPVSPGVVFWFRNDLRLHDQPALLRAVQQARQRGGWLLPVFVHDPAQQAPTRWGFARTSAHRRAWLVSALGDLSDQLDTLGSRLVQLQGDPATVLGELVAALDGPLLVCEEIAAPEEQGVVLALRRLGVTVHTVWQSTLVAPEQLPFGPGQVPDTFTVFRQALERAGVQAAAPLPAPQQLPPCPPAPTLVPLLARWGGSAPLPLTDALPADARSAFPCRLQGLHGGERAALAHLQRYCQRRLPHSYKLTRNGLIGLDYSSKWSPWLATGALSPRQAWAAIRAFEAEHGANDGTYWLWFELLWRDHFRWLHLKHGRALYRASGLARTPPDRPLRHDAAKFARWCQGRTGQPFIDAGMRELAATGYLSNRLRQNVASYLIHDLNGDWRAGAAWFEAQLLDYDVYSNQGNWLYLSGRGTDPRASRRFNPDKQARDYDPDGAYRRLWGTGA